MPAVRVRTSTGWQDIAMQGPPGPSSGAAGGVLAGTYPNPTNAPGAIVNADIAAAAAIALSKLAGYPSDSSQYARGDGSWGASPYRIYDTTLLGSAASMDTGATIPQTFAHLLMVWFARSDRAVTGEDVSIQFNGSATAYCWAQIPVSTGAISGTNSASTTTGLCGICAGASSAAQNFGGGFVFVPHYRSNQGKSYVGVGGTGIGLNGRVVMGGWQVTSAITQLRLIPGVGPNFIAGSRMTVYGLG